MIRLSRLTDYAVVILAAMASKEQSLLSASNLSDITAIPEPTVSKVLKILAKSGLLESVRGAHGGYSITASAENIRIHDIITAIEGPVSLTSCVTGSEESCMIESQCQLHGRWNIVNSAIQEALDDITLADMISENDSLSMSRQVGSVQ